MNRFTRIAGGTLLLLGAVAPLRAQDLPAATDVLSRYREAVGAARYADVKSMQASGEFSIPAAGMTGQIEVWSGRPNRSALRVTIPGFGEMRSGFTGAVGWAMNPMEGARLLDGPEAKQAADDADFDSFLRPAARIESMTTVEKTTMAGQECIKVKIVWKSGRQVNDCFSTETGLIVASVGTTESSMGAIESITLIGEYREFDGIKVPTRVTTQLMGAEQVITLKEVRFNAVTDAALDPPAEIKALIKT